MNKDKKVIYHKEWDYALYELYGDYYLWVYLGGIAEQVKEITLSKEQIARLNVEGQSYIELVAADLHKRDSETYSLAIDEGRRTL